MELYLSSVLLLSANLFGFFAFQQIKRITKKRVTPTGLKSAPEMPCHVELNVNLFFWNLSQRFFFPLSTPVIANCDFVRKCECVSSTLT